jgi:hypothetical protein
MVKRMLELGAVEDPLAAGRRRVVLLPPRKDLRSSPSKAAGIETLGREG